MDHLLVDPSPSIRAGALVAIRYVAGFPVTQVRRIAEHDPQGALRKEAEHWLQRVAARR